MLLKTASILVIDDDTDILTAVRLLLKTEAKEVLTEKNPEQIPQHLSGKKFDLILLDMNFKSAVNSGNEGFYWLEKIKKLSPATPVVMITAYAAIDLAIRALKEGAADFIVKPWHNDKLIESIKDVLSKKEHDTTSSKNKGVTASLELIGESAVMQDLFYKIEKVGPTDANILILGENGTGKDLIAKALHNCSLRSKKAFIKVDVGALTDTLFESELFGHKKGAFTDAREDRAGRFESADTGTLFLDEIGNIALQQQSKLLTVLQNRQITPLGANNATPIDIRLICATNVGLKDLSDEKRFRKDLIYRINTVELVVPPLRQRGSDIILLANYFCKMYTEKYAKPAMQLDKSAIDKLLHYAFPGNVRELQYIIERAIIMAEGPTLKAADLLFSPLESKMEDTKEELNLSVLEKNTIMHVIEKNNGNISKAAKELGLTRAALYRRLSKYDS
ncbi:MAG TPA: sigma-54 dependent transcriptional regulator [Bacteroidia bacterium]|nr:sigma-54 dependent transcriptional regulator [Bacteroidia bacterium]